MLSYHLVLALTYLLEVTSASEGNLMRELLDERNEINGDHRTGAIGSEKPCFENEGREPNEKALGELSKAGSGNFNPDDTKANYENIKTDFEKPISNPDESFFINRDICSNYEAPEDPDEIDFPSLAVEDSIFDEKKTKWLIKKEKKEKKENRNDERKKEQQESKDVRRLQKKSSSYYTVSAISSTKIRVDWYVSNWILSQDYLFLCWKKSGQFAFSLCNKNNKSIKPSDTDVTYVGTSGGLKHYYYIVTEHEGSALQCDTKYKFDITITNGWFMGSKKETTWGCGTNSVNCLWGDAITAFGGSYVIQSSHLEKTDRSCVIHRGDFNGDGKTDILRTCNNKMFNALWRGNNVGSGFSLYGYVYTGSLLQNTADTCRLHIADFNGDGRDDFLRSCNNPFYNTVQYGELNSAPYPFKSGGYVVQTSVLQNNAGFSSFKLHIGDFNGDGKADILRTHATPAYNYLWIGNSGLGGFSPQGYQLQTLLLENANNDCRIHIGNFDGDANGIDDLLRTCDNPTLNRFIRGTSSGFVDVGQIFPGSILEKKNKTCRLHIADYNGDNVSDFFRTCDDPFYNHLRLGGDTFSDKGYQLQGNMLQNSINTCRLHIGDYNGDGKADLFRSCNSRCYNALFISNGNGFNAGKYTLTSAVLEYSSRACMLHVGDYNGDSHSDLLRTCNNPYYNALLKSIL